MNSISKYLGFTEQDIIEIIKEEKIDLPKNTQLLEELKRQHNLILSV